MRKVRAEALIRELTQDTSKVSSRLRRGRRLLPLHNARIVGKFDLTHRTIKKPISFQDCEFEDAVDLRYCEFERPVDFLRCTFHREFTSGNYKEPRTLYRRDLNCSKSTFLAPARFIGIRVEDSGYFDQCRFEYQGPEGYSADFTGASFGSNIECANAVFKGTVSFNSLRCDDRGIFGDADFAGDGNSTQVDFTGAYFGRNIECVNSKFGGRVRFDGLRCDDRGIFRGAKFRNAVSLRSATFGSHIVCIGTVFEGPASFNGIKCEGSGYFDQCRFEYQGPEECTVDFTGASFGSHIVCIGTVFEGPASFNSLRCAGSGHYDRARFERGVEFRLAAFGLVLRCQHSEFWGQVDASWVKCDYEISFEQAVFRQRVSFRGLSCGTTGSFKGATFEGDEVVDYRHSHFGADLDLRGAYFEGKVILAQTGVLNRLRLGAARFSGITELYGSEIKILELMDANYRHEGYPPSFKVRTTKDREGFDAVVRDQAVLDSILTNGPDKEKQRVISAFFPFRQSSLNLSDASFERFHGGPNGGLDRKLAVKLVEEQIPKKFSRDPYLQLEKYYTSIGEEDDAVRMHRRGHSALRQNAKNSRNPRKEGNVNWSWFKVWVTDLGLKYLTDYGTRAWLAVAYLLPLLVIGTYIYCGEHTLLKKSDLTSVGPISPGHSFAYTLDLLIPVLTFPLTETWVPDHIGGKIFSVVAVLAGWLLVPLFIAAWTGLIRPRNQ